MLATLACLISLGIPQAIERGTWLPEPKGEHKVVLYVPDERLDPPKISPKQQWMFDWIAKGYAVIQESDHAISPRIRVFSQEHKTFDDHAPVVARMALRLWEFNFDKLSLDHAFRYNNHIVDFYICYGGKAGSEQLFGQDDEGGKTHAVNTIYIYDLNSFASPIEMAREVAHEYGHATLVQVGGYTDPEDWANGYLGEKIYLRWIRDEMAAKHLDSDDVMGATFESVNQWVKQNVDPWVVQSATRPPTVNLARKDQAGMNAFLGLASYIGAILPVNVFSRSLVTIGSSLATDYPAAVVNAVAEHKELTLTVPPYLRGSQIYVPVGKGKVVGATILSQADGWAKIQLTPGTQVKIVNPNAEA